MSNEILKTPNNEKRVFLHVCCAPCSGAIIEYLIESGITPTIFFYNPNIHPEEEYLKRKNEVIKFIRKKNLAEIDADYNVLNWFSQIKGLENEPERGKRCYSCFLLRLEKTATHAIFNNFSLIATTMGISRWKDIDMVNKAGKEIQNTFSFLTYWDINWRKNNGSTKMSLLAKRENFYQQTYCGCIYSKNQQLKPII